MKVLVVPLADILFFRLVIGAYAFERTSHVTDGIDPTYEYENGTNLETTTDVEKYMTEVDENSTLFEENNASSTLTLATKRVVDESYLSQRFKCCTHVNLEPEFYSKLSNGSVHVPMYHRSFDREDYLIKKELLYLCREVYPKYVELMKFSPALDYVSIVCMGISATCIILHIIMFVLVKRLQNLPGYVLLSLCVALLSAYVCIFIQLEITVDMDCRVIGMFQLYFYLSSFFWMNTMSYDVWRSIRMATSKLRLTTDRPMKVRFARYSVYSWGMPLMVIITSIIVHNTTSDVRFKLIFNDVTCWFENKNALTVYFAIPLFVLLALNVVFFISSFYMISTGVLTNSASGSQSSTNLWSRLILSLKLGSVMGFMWILGLIAAFSNQEWLWYLYAICNGLQGVFIFFGFTVNERTREAFKKSLTSRKFSVMPTLSSTQSQRSQPTTSI